MTMSYEKILITGASGSLAKQLIHEFVERGIKPIAHVRESSNTEFIDKHGLEKRTCDLRQEDGFPDLLEGVDAVIHNAAWVNFRRDRLTQFTGINTVASVNLFKAAQQAGVKRFVQISTVSAIGGIYRDKTILKTKIKYLPSCNEDSEFNFRGLRIPYIMTKRAADDELLKLASEGPTELVIVCPSVIVAPSRTGDDRKKARKAFGKWFLPDFDNRLNLVDIRDVGPGVLGALEKGRPGEKYILAGDNIIVRDLVLDISSTLGVIPHLVRVPRRLLNLLARISLIFGRIKGNSKISFYPDLVKMLDYDWAYSSMKARRELGFTYRSLHVTLEDLLNNDMIGTWQRPRP